MAVPGPAGVGFGDGGRLVGGSYWGAPSVPAVRGGGVSPVGWADAARLLLGWVREGCTAGCGPCGAGRIVKHVVMFSSGAGSWAAARRVADQHGSDDLWLLFSDVSMEDEDNYRFLHEAAADVGGTFVVVKDGRDIWQVFKDNRFLGNSRLANCSKFLKQKPARDWLDANCDPTDTTVYVGIDWTESHRMAAVIRNYLPYVAQAPLCEPPYLYRDQILADLRRRKIAPPRLYDLGFAHANCGGGCVRAGQGQFAHLLQVMPERYAEWEANEQDLREHLGADVSILKDRAGGTAVPLTLRAFRERHESDSSQTDMFDIGGCGCFVAEDTP